MNKYKLQLLFSQFLAVGFKVSLLTAPFAVCVDRIQGGNVWIFKRTLASRRVFDFRLGGGL